MDGDVHRDLDLEPECKHGIWPAESCVICNGKERRQQKDDEWNTTDWQDR